MSQRRFGGIAAAAILLAVVVAPVGALAGGKTTITLNGFAVETFTATGDVVCPGGTATTEFDHFGGSDAGAAGSFHLTKTLVCTDGSGTFTIRVNAATVFGSPTDQGGWAVVGGTGDYATLKGGGNVVGTYVPDGIIDVYTGSLRT